MKLISNILMLTLVWFICGARSCSSDYITEEQHMQKVLAASKDSIKQVFAFNYPSDQQLRALEATAVRKLNDFNDLLNIVTDTSIDISFRQQAAEMARKLFIQGTINARSWSKSYSKAGLNTIEQVLQYGITQGSPCKASLEQITVSKSLNRENDSVYKGSLTFYIYCNPINNSDPAQKTSAALVTDIYSIKKVKSFGKEQFKLWDVYLGDIY